MRQNDSMKCFNLQELKIETDAKKWTRLTINKKIHNFDLIFIKLGEMTNLSVGNNN